MKHERSSSNITTLTMILPLVLFLFLDQPKRFLSQCVPVGQTLPPANFASYLPHPSCQYANKFNQLSHGNLQLHCTPQGPERSFSRYVLPVNLNVNLIHPKTTSLIMKVVSIASDFAPLPANLTNFTAVTFERINLLPRDIRFPFRELFSNVKKTIRHIRLELVKMLFLEKSDLDGFENLESLQLIACQLKTIERTAFEGMSSLPKVFLIKISQMYGLRELDLGMFEPVQNTLKVLDLKKNGVIWTSSKWFTFTSLESLVLDHNEMTHIPDFVLQTLPLDRHVSISANGNKFCPNATDCSCCQMAPYLNRLKRFQKLHQAPAKCTKRGLPNDLEKLFSKCKGRGGYTERSAQLNDEGMAARRDSRYRTVSLLQTTSVAP